MSEVNPKRGVPNRATLASISAVERDTGVSKDTLRVWERRYGFPTPARDSNGKRVYPAEQLEKLRVIRRLMDSGFRAGDVVGESLRELNAHVKLLVETNSPPAAAAPVADEALHLLQSHQTDALRQLLSQAMLRMGLQQFVLAVATPLSVRVGNAWIEGGIQIFEEHLYAELMQHLLRQAMSTTTQSAQEPCILLTTLPGEQHKLGLLMAEAYLSVEGARCISLGVQTPAWDIVQAARAHRVDIVGLSFSQAMPLSVARAGLLDVRQQLDRNIALWAGGSLWQGVRKTVPGVTMLASLTAIPAALLQWREAR